MGPKSLVVRVEKDGWASASGDVDWVRRQAASVGWTEVAVRRGDATLSVLRPVVASAARPKSLSATYGLGQQPLHTDGAHLPDPPDFVALISTRPSTTTTLLWRASTPARSRSLLSVSAALSHGMFLVVSGRDSFYAPALLRGRYRYDPGCMVACDVRAREVEDYFRSQLPIAKTYEWTAPEPGPHSRQPTGATRSFASRGR